MLETFSFADIQKLTSFIAYLGVTLASLYFAYQKIGNSIYAWFSLTQNEEASVLDKLLLINRKNKPVIIFSIYAIIDKETQIELNRYSPPSLLEQLGFLELDIPVSKHYAKTGLYPLNVTTTTDVRICLNTSAGRIDCRRFNKFIKWSTPEYYYLKHTRTRRNRGWYRNPSIDKDISEET